MTNKKELSENRTLRKVQGLSKEFLDEVFANRFIAAYEILEFMIGDESLCYVCMDMPPGELCLLHLYIPPEKRSHKNIMIIKDMFFSLVHPWCKRKGKTCISVNCDSTDTKTIELFKTFNFNPKIVAVAIMLIQD